MQFGGVSFTYDTNGNLTNDGSRTFTWNARNQLTALAGPVSGSFLYDGFGRRRVKTVGGTATGFLYDGLNPVQELAGGLPSANLLTGLGIDEYVTRTDGAGARSFLTDALGSTLALTDSTGAVQTEYTSEPFGQFTTGGASTSNAFGFTGPENDGTGLYFFRVRYYSPGFERFVGEDPLDFQGGSANFYSYVRNSPLNQTDPFGLWVRNWDPVNPVPVKREEGPWGKLPPCMEYPGSPDGWLPPGKAEGPPWYKVPGKSWTADNNVEIGPGDRWVCVSGPCKCPRIPLLNPGSQVLPKAPDETWIPPVTLPDLPGIRLIPGCKPKGSKSNQ